MRIVPAKQFEEEFKRMQDAAYKLNETRDCAVKATAFACEISYEETHAALKAVGRKHRKGTPNHLTRKVIKKHGLKTEKYEHRAKTVRTLARELRFVRGTFLVWTHGHILCIKNGKVMDWTKGRLHRVLFVERVVRSEPKPESLRIAANNPPKVDVDIRKVFENHRKHWGDK